MKSEYLSEVIKHSGILANQFFRAEAMVLGSIYASSLARSGMRPTDTTREALDVSRYYTMLQRNLRGEKVRTCDQ